MSKCTFHAWKNWLRTALLIVLSFPYTLHGGLLVNSKEIADSLKAAIIEAGLTLIGFLCAAGGLLFMCQGLSHIIHQWGHDYTTRSLKQGFTQIIIGMLFCSIGITAIKLYGR